MVFWTYRRPTSKRKPKKDKEVERWLCSWRTSAPSSPSDVLRAALELLDIDPASPNSSPQGRPRTQMVSSQQSDEQEWTLACASGSTWLLFLAFLSPLASPHASGSRLVNLPLPVAALSGQLRIPVVTRNLQPLSRSEDVLKRVEVCRFVGLSILHYLPRPPLPILLAQHDLRQPTLRLRVLSHVGS